MIWYTFKECPSCKCSVEKSVERVHIPEKVSDETVDEKPRKVSSSGHRINEYEAEIAVEESSSMDILYIWEQYWRYGFALAITCVIVLIAIAACFR